MSVLATEVTMVDPATLLHHPRNPRQGDVGAIAQSIQANGFYGAVVVQRATGYVLIGNHRVEAALALSLPLVPVMYVDVDDEQALRILVSENRTNDLAAYDDAALVAILQEIQATPLSLDGTGFDSEDLDRLAEQVSQPLTFSDTCPTCGRKMGKRG